MKAILLSLIMIFIGCRLVIGQSGILKLIEKGNFEKAEKELAKEISKNPNDIIVNYTMSVLLVKQSYKLYNPANAYEYIQRAKYLFENEMDEKAIKELDRIPLNGGILENLQDTVIGYALQDAIKANEVQGFGNFLSYYKKMPEKYRKIAVEKRNNVAFNVASQINTLESFQSFINSYPDALQIKEAVNKRNSVAFENVKATNTIEAYKIFISNFPKANEANQAWESVFELAFKEAIKTNTLEAFNKFIKEYPQSKQAAEILKKIDEKQFLDYTVAGSWKSYRDFILNYPKNSWRPVAEDSLYKYTEKSNDLEILKFCADNFTGNRKNTVILKYHDAFTIDGEKITLDVFYGNYKNLILNDLKLKDYRIAEMGDELTLELGYKPEFNEKYDEYIKLAAPNEKAFVALQRIISNDIDNRNWNLAVEKVKRYSSFFGRDNKKIVNLISLLEKKWDNTIQIHSVGKGVNSEDGDEYACVISADGKLLYFCGRNRSDNIGGEDIYISKNVNNSWITSKIIPEFSSQNHNEAPECISSNGIEMILFIDGDQFKSEKDLNGWSEPVEISGQINKGSWQAEAKISSDGKSLVFASDKKGGLNRHETVQDSYHGDDQYQSDIYMSFLDENNEWGEPINLGSTINTMFCERSPFLHPDMKTLYFCSDGHGGLGGLDVFKSVRLSDTCWNCWSEPQNLGKEINTTDNEMGYRISTDGEKAYFSKTNVENNKYDIYWLNIPNNLRPELVATVTGKLIDQNNQPVSSEIRWEDLETGKNVGRSKSDPSDGSYFIVLPMGKIYGYYVEEEKYFPLSNNLDLRKGNKPINVQKNIEMVSYKQMKDDGKAVTINNIFFDFAKSTLLPYSIPELKRVAKIIIPSGLKVEISGHTDNVGDDKSNQVLSEQRAKAVRDFLVSEGCIASNFKTIGYGKSKPASSNNSEEGRALNRRVELKFIK